MGDNMSQNVETNSEVWIEKSIIQHYDHILHHIQDNKHLLQSKKEYDFYTFEPFYTLVLEFLTELDKDFIDDRVAYELDQIKQTRNLYKCLQKIQPEDKKALFKTLILQNHTPYNRYLCTMKKYKHAIQTCEQSLTKGKSSELIAVKKRIKKYKQGYIETKNRAQEIKHSSYKSFQTQLNTVRKRLKDRLISILSTRCYHLNKAIWQRANTLSAVKTFNFKNGIEGYLDGKAFLKHYLKTTDMPHESDFYKQMVQVLTLFKNQKRKSMAIIYDAIEDLERMKNILQAHDKELIVKGYLSHRQLLKESKSELDLIIIDYHLRGLKDDLQQIQKLYKDSDFLLLFQKNSKDDLMEAINSGLFKPQLKNCILKPKFLNPKNLTFKVDQLL